MKHVISILNVVLVYSCLVLTSCTFPDTLTNYETINKFKISNINNLEFIRNDKLPRQRGNIAYSTQFTLTNLSEDTFSLSHRSFIMPHHSLGWEGKRGVRYINYEYFGKPIRHDSLLFSPADTIQLYMKVKHSALMDSILYRPELVFKKRRYRLEYMFRKNDEGTGYYLKDNISSAVMMKDTIADY